MVRKKQTRAGEKTSAKSPAKSQGTAQKLAKVRAASLSNGHTKKTTPARSASRKAKPVNRLTRAKAKPLPEVTRDDILPEHVTEKHMSEREWREGPTASGVEPGALDPKAGEVTQDVITKPFADLHETLGAISTPLTAPETGTALGDERDLAAAIPRAAAMTLMPLGMMVRQQALAFSLIVESVQMQRHFFEMWRPRQE